MIALFGVVAGAMVTSAVTQVFAHGGSSNLIHACVKTSTGSIRVVSAADTCSGNETALDWNKEGAPGLGTFVGNLVNADFVNADLRYRSFNGRDVSGSIFVNANLTGSDFSNANLTNGNFDTVNLFRANLTNANLTGISLHRADLKESTGINSAILTNAYLGYIQSDWLDLSNKDLTTVNLERAQLNNANLSNSNLSGNNLTAVFLTNANLTSANLSNANLDGVDANYANFTNTNLSGATSLDAVRTQGAIWNNTICPDGTNSNNNGNTCDGHL